MHAPRTACCKDGRNHLVFSSAVREVERLCKRQQRVKTESRQLHVICLFKSYSKKLA